MKKHFYGLFSVLAVVLLMAACGGENELIQPIKAGINSENYEAALSAADSALLQDPTNSLAYYYKAVAYDKIAAKQNGPFESHPYYVSMRENLDKAESIFDTLAKPPVEYIEMDQLILSSWGREHNEAIGFATNDSIMATVENPLDLSIAHLINAVTINPDSSLSYDVLSQIYQMNNDFENAAKTLEKAMEIRSNDVDASDYDRLASYYFQVQDFESALKVIETGLESFPDSVYLIQKVADAYFQTGNTEKALEVVNGLIDSDPSNPQYRLVVGTQLYQQVQVITEEINANNDKIFDLEHGDGDDSEVAALEARNEELRPVADDLIVKAESALLKAYELDPKSYTALNTLGILYQNKAAALYELRNNAPDDEYMAYEEAARAEAEKAVTYYEKAAELRPEDSDLWRTLFQIYTILDYREKAEAAMEKAGM